VVYPLVIPATMFERTSKHHGLPLLQAVVHINLLLMTKPFQLFSFFLSSIEATSTS